MIAYKGLNMITCGTVNCCVIRGSEGDALIDTGAEGCRGKIGLWLSGFNIKLIILTHGHSDHTGNARYFSELYNAPVMISPYDMRLARDNTARPYYITNPVGHIMKNQTEKNLHMRTERFDPKIFAEEGMDLKPYGIDGTVISLEGHTKGSIGILCRGPSGTDLYAGDAVMNAPVPMFPMIAESPLKAREAMERIVTLSPDRIIPGHGSPICRGGRAYQTFAGRF